VSTRSFLSAEARKRIGDTVRAIETRTAAEVVVTVRARSATHRQVDLAAGAVAAFVALLVYVYFPIEFADDTAPLGIASCFVAAAMLTSALDPLKRLFLLRETRRHAVRREARASFVDQRIGATRARTGVLVFVSLLEREVEVVADLGIDPVAGGAAWSTTLGGLGSAVAAGADVEAFARALLALGDVLASIAPVGEGDVNELPDEVVS
jgi:putative membrane protein